MKKIVYPIFAFMILAGACKKDKLSDDKIKNTDNLLTDPVTGWKRVAILPFDELGAARGTTPYNSMQGFDLQKTGGQFSVLYTQHNLDLSNRLSADYFYKALVAENATAQPEKISFGIFSGGGMTSPFTYYGQFLPGTYTPVFTGMDYTNHYIELRDKDGKIYAGAPASNYPQFAYLPDGEFIAGSIWVGHESFLWHYKNPPDPVGDFSSTYRPGIIDGNKRLFNIPIKTVDGNYCEFSLCSKNNTITFLAIRCREDRTYGATPPNYEIVDSGTVANPPQNGFSSDNVQLLTYDYNSTTGEITFVFQDFASTTGAPFIYCYRWKQGSFTNLWQTSLGNDEDLKNAIKVYTNKNMLNEWRLKPDGTFYLMANVENPNPDSNSASMKLWEVNSSGAKVLSTITYGQSVQKSVGMSTCRYIDGAYYALAFPTGEYVYKIGDPHFHMELVKLDK